MKQELLTKYAEFAVKVGVNVQKGQTLIINCGIENAHVARECASVAYSVGAKEVVVKYTDEKLSRIKMEHTSEEVLCNIMPYVERSYLDYVESEGGACVLHIIARDPEIFKGLDTAKIDKANIALRNAMMNWREYTMKDKIQWCIVAVPTPAWATKIFPEVSEDEAVEKLWDAIFDVTRVTNGDPVKEWKEHIEKTVACRDKLNALQLDRVHMQSSNGTDIVIGLADDCIWEGAQSVAENGATFIANIPTEEVFTAPHKDKVNGVVKGTKPYIYNGDLIENFSVTFKDGKVVEYSATKGENLLGMLLDTDEGSRRIGEIALVPASSPINQKNILFYNTLFDENAACHIAFGSGYPGTVKDGAALTKEQLLEKGVNYSVIHEDVMVGACDTQITGYTKDGKAIKIFIDGEWAL